MSSIDQKVDVAIYFSDRGFPLVYWGPPPEDGYILTVENYCKWYTIYRIDPTGQVDIIPDSEVEFPLDHVFKEGESTVAWVNHVPTPGYCKWLEESNGDYRWDQTSLDMIVGRYYREVV